ncbi:helix-turn-helix domain-containing protein [Desulfitobacterium sp. PCE1]|uniref:winged helix-turn-helix transcriptional regulator n=1 Tax=Desulfitobacterium sp. PCE1 TaxID=146907 RepID=UPI00036D8AE7|nr:helix-turn-helix domain-containing protein [Desulfitobacterium sp. PCE1]
MGNKNEVNYSCPIEYTMNLIAGKWKLVILWHLSQEKVMRYGEIKKSLNNITHKMLSQQLKELEADGFIHRKAYSQIPPKVEYSLTSLGESFFPILESISKWGKHHFKENEK